MWPLLCIVFGASQGANFKIEPVPSSSGLYYQPAGTARLYSTEWRILTYLSLEEASANVDAIRKYIEFMIVFCTKHSTALQTDSTICKGLLDTIKKEYDKIQELRGLVLQLTRIERGTYRQKRAIFDMVGQVAHSLFGLLDAESEEFYDQKILHLEKEQLDWLKLSREQIFVVQSTLRSVNRTLQDVSTHELSLTKDLSKILKYVKEGNKKIKDKYAFTAFMLALNEHTVRIRQAMQEVKELYDTMMQVCLNWKSGVVHPQVLSPVRLMEVLKLSQDGFPRDLEVPMDLSEAYAYLLYNIVSVEVYLVKSNLVYVVKVPLTTHYVFNVYEIIPFPVHRKGEEGAYTFVQSETKFLVLDDTKGLYAKVEQTALQQCKRKQPKELICKQDFPLFSRHSSTDCEVLLLQPVQSLPPSCMQKVVELKETLWIPLVDSTWLFVAPAPERLTVSCTGQEPTDVEIKGKGVLTFLSDCTGYGTNVVIKSFVVHSINNTGKDVIHPLILTPDCCEVTLDTLSLGEVGEANLEIPVKGISTHDEDLHVANHRANTVKRLIDEHEWKGKNTTEKSMSYLSMLGIMVFVVFSCLLCFCCCLCRCCRNCWLRIVRWWYFDDRTYGTIVFRPKIVTSLSTSNEGRRGESTLSLMSRAHVVSGRSDESHSLPHGSLMPVGKR